MKGKISRLIGVCTTIALIARVTLPLPVEASDPGNGQWVVQDIPSATGNVILQNSQSMLRIPPAIGYTNLPMPDKASLLLKATTLRALAGVNLRR
jgi:hypothetical protein